MGKKKGILLAGPGTSHMDALEKTIAALERDIEEHFPEYQIYRAFTSQRIVKKLKKNQIPVLDVKEALERMTLDGVKILAVQSSHVINGMEYDNMRKILTEYEDRFEKVSVSAPLLSNAEDYKKVVHTIMENVRIAEDEALVVMGHGTGHHANSAYPALEYTFHLLGYPQVLVGTAEGFPDLEAVMMKLRVAEYKKVTIMPLMVTAGSHVRKTMAGERESWKTKLEEAGYEIEVMEKGLGEMKGIRHLFLEHLRAAM